MKPRFLALIAVCVMPCQSALSMRADSAPAAIVAELRGSASVKEAGKPQRALQPYDWVHEGASISVAKGSRAVLVFANGARFALKEGARVTLGSGTLSRSTGVEQLSPLSPLPVVAPIASATAQPISAATRVRGPSIRNVYPTGHAALAERTTLHFDGPRGVIGYQITVEDNRGTPVLQREIEKDGAFTVPSNVLEPGREYRWRVTVIGSAAAGLSARGAFVTLPASTAEARSVLRATLSDDDLGSVLLLARVDEHLGLFYEAREALAAAAAKAPEDKLVQQMLGRVQEHLP
jgi:hypothetical protein